MAAIVSRVELDSLSYDLIINDIYKLTNEAEPNCLGFTINSLNEHLKDANFKKKVFHTVCIRVIFSMSEASCIHAL